MFNEYLLTSGLFLECCWEAMVLDSSCLSNKANKIYKDTHGALVNEIRSKGLEELLMVRKEGEIRVG